MPLEFYISDLIIINSDQICWQFYISRFLTMSTISAIVTMKMAAMAQVLRAQRVWSIHVEKDTSFFGKT